MRLGTTSSQTLRLACASAQSRQGLCCSQIYVSVSILNKTFANIGITHVFSCINICRVPRLLFKHEADRPSDQTSSEGPGKCKCNGINSCDRYSCIFYPFPTQFALKSLLKHSIVHFLTLDFSKQDGVGCVLSNVTTS